MGGIFSYTPIAKTEETINEINEIQKIENEIKEFGEVAEEITKRVIESVLEDIAVIEIEKRLPKLEPIKENKQYNCSKTLYSNLHNDYGDEKLKHFSLNYKPSELTKFYNLYECRERRFTFYC